MTSFNSKMVRLIVYAHGRQLPCGKWFQFQNGSINSENLFNKAVSASQFQFQNGSINRLITILQRLLFLRFNSKMVRLIVRRGDG